MLFRSEDGTPVAAGTTVEIQGQKDPTFAGFGGEVFINNLISMTRLVVKAGSGDCLAEIEPDVLDAGPLPRLGPIRCTMKRM